MKHLTVSDVMTHDVVTADTDTPFKDLAALMGRHRVGVLPVTGDNDRVIGVVSQSDLLVKESSRHTRRHRLDRWMRPAAHRRAEGATAGQLMTKPAVTVAPSAPLSEAAREMVRRQITHLPVVDSVGELVGILARSDLLRTFLADDDAIRRVVEHDVLEGEMWLDPQEFTVEVHDGVVSLAGVVERRSLVSITENLIASLDGVVGVVNHLTYQWDDAHPQVQPFRDPSQIRH